MMMYRRGERATARATARTTAREEEIEELESRMSRRGRVTFTVRVAVNSLVRARLRGPRRKIVWRGDHLLFESEGEVPVTGPELPSLRSTAHVRGCARDTMPGPGFLPPDETSVGFCPKTRRLPRLCLGCFERNAEKKEKEEDKKH
jgi:hypothetical protein